MNSGDDVSHEANGKLYYRTTDGTLDSSVFVLVCLASGATLDSSSCAGASASSAGDPHLTFAYNGQADFRGRDDTVFSFVEALHLTFNVLTTDRTFQRWGGQIVHGSFFTGAYFRMHHESTGVDLRIAILAEEPTTYRLCLMTTNVSSVAALAECDPQSSSLHLGGVSVELLSGKRVRVRASSFEIVISHRRLRKPIIDGVVVPMDHSSRWFLDTKVRALDGDTELSAKYNQTMRGQVYAHGIVGQSFDGSKIAVSGKIDKYDDAPEFTTSAQAEGAIEGVYTDYIVSAPFANDFLYARFDARTPVPPRNVSLLTGTKARATSGAVAGSVEQHGVEDMKA